MSYGPTYITRTKHGVYYFQVRNTGLLKQRYGFAGKLIRKSLRTKNKRLALARARYLWLLLFENQVMKNMVKQNNMPSLEEQERIINEQREIDRVEDYYD